MAEHKRQSTSSPETLPGTVTTQGSSKCVANQVHVTTNAGRMYQTMVSRGPWKWLFGAGLVLLAYTLAPTFGGHELALSWIEALGAGSALLP